MQFALFGSQQRVTVPRCAELCLGALLLEL